METVTHIKQYIESEYEQIMEEEGWAIWGQCMTKEGYMYIWKKETKTHTT